jgi:hypothetical protein
MKVIKPIPEVSLESVTKKLKISEGQSFEEFLKEAQKTNSTDLVKGFSELLRKRVGPVSVNIAASDIVARKVIFEEE